MITTRERVRISELLARLLSTHRDVRDLFKGILPLDARHWFLTSQGKAAFEQIVLSAKLQQSRMLVPAFFSDDFVGVFRKHEITPVFVDVDLHTYQLDLDRISAEQLQGARALIVLHPFGLPADGLAVRAFCDEHGLLMIEDCAHALGASRAGRLVGSFGHYALYSLPKCTPVRAGGVALAERPLQRDLQEAQLGISGFLHAMALVKYPVPSRIEAAVYALVADTSLYPREVGNYEALPARELDWLARLVLEAFMPRYSEALARKRQCALRIRYPLEAEGFTFQADAGEHIYTALAVHAPSHCDPDELLAFLLDHGIKAAAMWRTALGVSPFAQKMWGADPQKTPAARQVAKRVIQLPISRHQTEEQSARIVSLCQRFCARRRARVSCG